MAAPLLLTSGSVVMGQARFACLFVCLFVCLFDAIATLFQLCHGSEIKRTKPEPTLLQTQGIFNLRHIIGMV